MQQEDDLRGLAKVMQFMRALSLLFALIHFYWYAYSWITAVGWNTALVDKILMNFQRTSGLFSSPLYTKLFCLLFLALSCLGTRSVRSEKISRRRIALCGAAGILLFFCGGWLLRLPLPVRNSRPALRSDAAGRLLPDAGRRGLARTADQRARLRVPVQRRKRILHAGDPPDDQRLLGKLTYAVLLQKTMASGLDQRRQSLPRDGSCWERPVRENPTP